MISDFDRTLEQLFERDFGTPLPFDLSFAMPDRDFTPVASDRNTLNCYLYDISEDRELRQVDPRLQRNEDGTFTKEPAPARIRLAYCITAWSPAQTTPAVVPALDEHHLLSQVLVILLRYPLIPADVLAGTLAGQIPPLPTSVVMPSDVKSTSEFWSAIGGQLRPSLDYVVTLSMAHQPAVVGPMVTSQTVTYEPQAMTTHADERVQIGGYVLDNASTPNRIENAWVLLEETGQVKITNAEGQFTFQNLTRGIYTMRVRAMGFQEASRVVRVPELSGEYNLQLVPS